MTFGYHKRFSLTRAILFFSLTVLLLAPTEARAQLDPLAGAYTIGGLSADFQRLSDAVRALNDRGVSSAVTFEVANGTYNTDSLYFNVIDGSSATNRVTFRAADGADVEVIHFGAVDTDSTMFYSGLTLEEPIVRISGTDYLTFDGIDFSGYRGTCAEWYACDDSTMWGPVMELEGVINGLQIKNGTIATWINARQVYIYGPGGEWKPPAIFSDKDESLSDKMITTHNLVISGNVISGSGRLLKLIGNPAEPSTGTQITDNSFASPATTIRMTYQNGATISRNTISSSFGEGIVLRDCDGGAQLIGNTVTFSDIDGSEFAIMLDECDGPVRIENNRLLGKGLSVSGTAPTAGSGRIFNNIIRAPHRTDENESTRGLNLQGSNYDVYHNTIIAGDAALIAVDPSFSSTESLNIRNNILASDSRAALAVEAEAVHALDYNNLYSTGPYLVNWLKAGIGEDEEYETLSAFQQGTGFGSHSLNVDPAVVPSTDAEVNSPYLDQAGANLSSIVPADIDGASRSSTPSIGAYEYTSTLTPIPGGTYTVPGNYASLHAAAGDLAERGIEGPVVIEVAAGVYTEQATITPIPGATAENTVTIRPASGAGVEFSFTVTDNGNADDDFGVHLKSADHVIFDGVDFTITEDNELPGHAILLSGNVRGVTIMNGTLDGVNLDLVHQPYGSILYAGGDFRETVTRNLTIKSNTFTDGTWQIYLGDSRLSFEGSGTRITDNTFTNGRAGGIYLTNHDSLVIARNTIELVDDTPENASIGIRVSNATDPVEILQNKVTISAPDETGVGIYVSGASLSGGFRIEENRISVSGGNGDTDQIKGLDLFMRIGPSSEKNLVANNFISVGGNGRSQGITVSSTTGTCFFNNTTLVTSTYDVTNFRSAALRIGRLTEATNSFVNNIFVNRSGGYAVSIDDGEHYRGRYNNLYTTGETLAHWSASYPDTEMATLADLQGAGGQDSFSVSVDVSFVSTSDLHLTGASEYDAALGGLPLTAVTTDIDGDARNAVLPTMGADEATSLRSIQAVNADGRVDFGGTASVDIVFSDVSGSGDVSVGRSSDGAHAATGAAGNTVTDFTWCIKADDGLSFGPNTEVRFKISEIPGNRISDPTAVSVLKRDVCGAGAFDYAPTTYDATTGEIVARAAGFSEFIITDVPPQQPSNNAPSAASITTPANDTTLLIEGDPDDPFIVKWNESTDVDGDTLRYIWQLSANVSFSDGWFESEATDAPKFTSTVGVIAGVLKDNGVATGDSAALYHRVITSDGDTTVTGPAAAITLIRGAITDSPPQPPSNNAPAADNDAASLDEDGTATVDILANDSDADDDNLSFAIVTAPKHGTAESEGPASIHYTPASNYNGPDTLTYEINDGNGGSARAIVTFVVHPVNDAPAAASITTPASDTTLLVEGDPDDPFIVKWNTSTDVDGDTLRYTWQLSGSESFSEPWLESEITDAPKFTSTFGVIADVLTDNGVATGESAALYHRVVTSDGDTTVAGPAAAITLIRGAITAVRGPENLPETFTLEHNYPNPFSRMTTIRYGLPQAEEVTISIYNILGQRVRMVTNGRQTAGWHTIELSAEMLPNGVYFYRFQAGDHMQVRKMLVVK